MMKEERYYDNMEDKEVFEGEKKDYKVDEEDEEDEEEL